MLNFWAGAKHQMAGVDVAPEAVRNRVLRRADWRFLLPDPQPERSVCFADGLLAEAVAAVSGHVVDARAAGGGECDLAVAVNPDAATLRAMWAALRDGGSCYTEWHSLQAGGPKRIRRALRSAGFEDVRVFWPWPWPSRAPAQFWLPLDAPAALDHFLDQRAPIRGIARRAGYTARRSAWRAAARAGLLVPVCVVARKPARSPGTNSDLLERVRSEWATWGFGASPERVSQILLTGGRRSINKVVGLVSDGENRSPRLVVKMPRVLEAVPALRREAEVLQAVHAQRPAVRGIPRVLFCAEQASFFALGESMLTGAPLYTRLRRGTHRALAAQATDWLIELAGRPERSSRATWRRYPVEDILAEFRTMYGAVLDRDLLTVTQDVLAMLGDLPLVCEQRDFSPWNVLLDEADNLVVLDWESAELRGLPAVDLIYFLTYLNFFLDGAMESDRYRRSYRNTLDASTYTGGVFAECAARYADRVGLDPAALPPLRLLTWMLHARSEHRRLAADAGGKPAADVLRRSLFVGLWEEELRHTARTDR